MSDAHPHHSARALHLDRPTSARIAMRAGSPPPNSYAQFAYSAIERAAREETNTPQQPAQSRPPFHRSRRERDPRSDLRPRPFSLPRHFRAPPPPAPPPLPSSHPRPLPRYDCPPVWSTMRRAQHPPPQQPQPPPPHQRPAPHRAPPSPHPPISMPHHHHHPPPPPPPPSHRPSHHHHPHHHQRHPIMPHMMYPYTMSPPAAPPPTSSAPLSRPAPSARPRSGHQHDHGYMHAHHHPHIVPGSILCPPPLDYGRPLSAVGFYGMAPPPAAAARTFYAMMDGRDPHRQKVKYVNPSFANQRTFLSVCPAGVASIQVGERMHRPGDVVSGNVVFEYAAHVSRSDAPIVDVPQVWVCCEVSRRQRNPSFCGGMPTPSEDISDVPVPPGHRPFVYHHYVHHRQHHSDHRHIGLSHAQYNHCSDLIRGDNGAPFRVPTVTSERRVNGRTVAFDFEFVLPDDLPHSYSWPDTPHGPGALLDIRYRLLVALEVQPRPGWTHSAPSSELPSFHPNYPHLYQGYLPFAPQQYSQPPLTSRSTSSSSRGGNSSLQTQPGSSRSGSVGSVSSMGNPSNTMPPGAIPTILDTSRYMVVCESYLLVASPVMPNPHIYLSPSDPRLGASAPKSVSAINNQQSIRVEVLDSVAQLDRPLTVRVTVMPDPHATSVNVRCGLEETVTFGASPVKRATTNASIMQMRQPVVNGRAEFMFTLAPPSELLYPTAVIGPLAVRHWVVASLVDYAVGDRVFAANSRQSATDHSAQPARAAGLQAEVPLALQPSVTPLDPNSAAHALAAQVALAHAPACAGARVRTNRASVPHTRDELVQLSDVTRNVWVRRRSAPSGAPAQPAPTLLKLGIRATDAEDDMCPICMTEVEASAAVGTLKCAHEGHRECMQNMVEFARKNRKDVLCPICRRRAEPIE